MTVVIAKVVAVVIKKRLTPAIVAVADRTLSADYKILFEGMFATMQTTKVPELAMKMLMAPKVAIDENGRASTVPLGLRRAESSLLANNLFKEEDVVCTTPEGLDKVVGPWTELVMVSSSDPLGTGMSNTTTDKFWDGDLYTKYWTERMMLKLRRMKDEHKFKIVGGGGGAWQWRYNQQACERHGIDAIYDGYFEAAGPGFIKDLINDSSVGGAGPLICSAKECAVDKVRPIMNASLLGIVELSRGCGKGCKFCTMFDKPMEHLPIETIVSDIRTNIAAGQRNIACGSEDFFRYGSKNQLVNFDRVCQLLHEIGKIPGRSFMQIDHGNISSVMQFSDAQLMEIRRLMKWDRRCDYLWVNMGVESANGHLVRANSPGKIAPFEPEDWEELTREAADKMIRCGFFPIYSVILGLPGETPADTARTLKLVKDLAKKRMVIFPIFYEPFDLSQRQNNERFTLEKMTADHLELYSTCYELNFREVPPMFWDNQRAGGVGFMKRALIRLLGKTEVRAWRKAFRDLRSELDRR